MDNQPLVPFTFDLSAYRFGAPQQSGALTVVPIFGPEQPGRFAAPLSGLKLSQVRGYGNMELANTAIKDGPHSLKEEVTRPAATGLLQRLGERLAGPQTARTTGEEGGLAIVPLHI